MKVFQMGNSSKLPDMAELAQAETEETLQFGSVDTLNKKAFRVIFENAPSLKTRKKGLNAAKNLNLVHIVLNAFKSYKDIK